jgi:hypothetical protein
MMVRKPPMWTAVLANKRARLLVHRLLLRQVGSMGSLPGRFPTSQEVRSCVLMVDLLIN